MKRREVIKLVSLATGAVLSAPLMNSLLVSCNTAPVKEDLFQAQFFSDEDFDLVKKIIDVVLPRTDSPSATDVGVHQIIDTMVATVYNPDSQETYKKQFSALKNVLNNATNPIEKVLNELINVADSDAGKGLRELRQQTIGYYLSTEEVSKNHLNYLPVPGDYDPCVSLEELGGKAWAI